ncbi:MAG: hypothetical protein RSA10_01480 [Bacilli bacterium]
MKEKFPEIFKNKIGNLKSKVQSEYYYHADSLENNNKLKQAGIKGVDKLTILKKVNSIFSRPDYVYQADVIIMFKNGEKHKKKIVGKVGNNLITYDKEQINIDDILDIK